MLELLIRLWSMDGAAEPLVLRLPWRMQAGAGKVMLDVLEPLGEISGDLDVGEPGGERGEARVPEAVDEGWHQGCTRRLGRGHRRIERDIPRRRAMAMWWLRQRAARWAGRAADNCSIGAAEGAVPASGGGEGRAEEAVGGADDLSEGVEDRVPAAEREAEVDEGRGGDGGREEGGEVIAGGVSGGGGGGGRGEWGSGGAGLGLGLEFRSGNGNGGLYGPFISAHL